MSSHIGCYETHTNATEVIVKELISLGKLTAEEIEYYRLSIKYGAPTGQFCLEALVENLPIYFNEERKLLGKKELVKVGTVGMDYNDSSDAKFASASRTYSFSTIKSGYRNYYYFYRAQFSIKNKTGNIRAAIFNPVDNELLYFFIPEHEVKDKTKRAGKVLKIGFAIVKDINGKMEKLELQENWKHCLCKDLKEWALK